MQTAISVNTPALGDTLAAIPTIRKVSKAYETPITVFTQFPELFQNHPCVKEAFPLNASKEGYNVLNTFSHLAGKTHNLNGNKVQFKYAHTDSRQYHALSLGFTLLPEEMETDLYAEENWEINFKNYIIIHATNTWPARTWSQENWQNLVYKLNELNIPVVAIGKSLTEHGNLATYDKSVMSIKIPYGINLMDHPDSSIPKVRNLIKKAKGIITMDSGILHLAGTTDTHIIQLGFNADPKFRAPYRKGTQDYKYTYVKGGCDLQCASSLKYNLKVHGHLQETPPVATCLEKKPTFECHPKVEDVIKAVKKLPTMKQKLLYITPHLSTGGAPQYLLKKIELLKEEYDISLVEYTDLGGKSFVVQKNKIFDIIPPENRITLGEDKTQLLDFLDKVQPNIVHLEEIPEMFMDSGVAEILYDKNRNYTIFETSHDSSQDPNNKRFFPDKFMFVSNWQIDQYKDIDVPAVLVEYPIEYKETRNRTAACKRLNLDPNKKHIIHVGLFTPRKNQAEFFEYARSLPEYEFHCIGNQAGNFKHYWEPLMKNKPDNLTWWGERNDVDNFYEVADLFLFTSKGNSRDKETMPLAIREALSWKLPILIYNLEVYQNYFNNYPVEYLTDFNQNINKIKSLLGDKISPDYSQEAFIISTYPITEAIINTTKECINAIKSIGRKIILTSHIPIPEELSSIVDYCINDNNNILTHHTFYTNAWHDTSEYKAEIFLKGENNNVYHGPACYSNYYNGVALAKNLDFKKVYLLNYDYIIKDNSYIDHISNILNTKDAFLGKSQDLEGDQIITWFLALKPDLLLNLPKITTGKDYDNLMNLWGAESNGYENLMYHAYKNVSNIHWEEKEKFKNQTNLTFIHKDYSRVEYFTILPTNKLNTFAPYFQMSNSNDSRLVKYTLYKNNELISSKNYEITNKTYIYDLVPYEEKDEFEIHYQVLDLNTNKHLSTKKFTVNNQYIKTQIQNNGKLTLKNLPS